jgi:hypothetical protein
LQLEYGPVPSINELLSGARQSPDYEAFGPTMSLRLTRPATTRETAAISQRVQETVCQKGKSESAGHDLLLYLHHTVPVHAPDSQQFERLRTLLTFIDEINPIQSIALTVVCRIRAPEAKP